MNQNREKGFTLVELLVVIAIVAILAGAVLVAINPLRIMRESRDAQRLSDMDTLNRALSFALADEEIRLLANGNGNSVSGSTAVDGSGWVSYQKVDPDGPGLGKYLSVLPVDPVNNSDYYYEFASSADAYELNAILESQKYQSKMENDGGSDPNRYEIGSDPGLKLL